MIDRKIARSSSDISFLLFALAGFAGLIGRPSVLHFGPGNEMVGLAENLVRHGTFSNPLMSITSGPSALAPPLYPLLLAGLMKVFSAPQLILWAVSLLSILANALTAALLPRVSLLWFNDVWPGAIASLFWILASQIFPAWDANVTSPVILLFCLYSGSASVASKLARGGIISGLIAGVLFHLNPMTLLIFLPWLFYLAVFQKPSLKSPVLYCSTVLVVVALVAAPWIARNHRILGSTVVRTGLGLNIYFSNNDCSGTNLYDDLHSGCALIYQPNYNLAESQAFRDLGELNYDRTRLAMAKVWMRTRSDRFIRLTLSRILTFWFPGTYEYPFKAAVIWIFTLMSIPGMLIMAFRRMPVTAFAIFVLLEYPLMYYLIVCDVRYRYPVLWLSLLPAGYFLAWLTRLIASHRISNPASVR